VIAASSLSSLTFDVLVWLFTLEVWEARLENGGHSLSEAWTGIIGCWYGGHRNRRRPLYVLCIKFKYLGSYFVPELNDTGHHWTDQPSEKAIRLHEQAITGQQNIPIDIRRRLYQAIVVNIALWEAKAGHWKSRSKLEAFHHECLRKMCGLTMWDVAEKRITNEHVRGMVANSPTMDTLMETRRCRWLSNSVQWKSQDLRGECLAHVYDGKTSRETSADHTTCLHKYSRSSALKRKGQLREWMTVARDRSAWGRKVEYKLELPPGSFTNLRRHWTKHERHIDKIGLDRRFNGKKSTTSFRDTRQN
jgi:hypothetical protein